MAFLPYIGLWALLFGTARIAGFPGWLRPALCLALPFVRWGVEWALVRPFRGAARLRALFLEHAFISLAFAGFLLSPLRFVCTPPTFVLFWAAGSLTIGLLLSRDTPEKLPIVARLGAVAIALVGFGIIEAAQPDVPHQRLMRLSEHAATWVKDMRDPMPVQRYVPYPAKPPKVHKPVVIPPLVLPAMLPDAAPGAILNYYRMLQTTFRARKKRFGTLYELQQYGARFVAPPSYLLGDIDLDEIGQPLDRSARAGLCMYPVEGRAGKLVRYGMVEVFAGEQTFRWKTAEADWLDVRQSLKRWPSEPKLALAPPDMTPKILATKARLSKILPTVRQFVAEQHRLPTASEALEKFPMLSHGELGAAQLLDAWARPFQFAPKPAPRAYSLGPDGLLDGMQSEQVFPTVDRIFPAKFRRRQKPALNVITDRSRRDARFFSQLLELIGRHHDQQSRS